MRRKGHSHGAVSPCAACKLLRRKCVEDCVFAPYFPAKEPYKFAIVHKIFGASNVNKMLQVKFTSLFCLFCCYIYDRIYITSYEIYFFFGKNYETCIFELRKGIIV